MTRRHTPAPDAPGRGETTGRPPAVTKAPDHRTFGAHALRGLLAAARGLALCGLILGVSPLLFSLTLVSLALIPIGLGLVTTPYVLDLVRLQARFRRQLLRDWAGTEVRSAYRPLANTPAGVTGLVDRTMRMLRDPATWRDVQWLFVDFTAGLVTALLPVVLLAEGVMGMLLAGGLWHPITGGGEFTYWYLFLPVASFPAALVAAALGVVLVLLGLRFNHRLLALHFSLTRVLLAPTRNQALARRVADLAETRHDALDSSAAHLRRIERDLHDGAQARLVAMGMSLGTAEQLLEKDPAQARKILAEARQSSADTLNELRDLVRGIHPPVLAERGLADAARALALRIGTPVEVEIDLDERLDEPVESAAYFAISEMLTNATKYSGAERIWLDVYYASGSLRMIVTDNGRGGADPNGGTGILGIERRLAAFDGTLAISSPAGGPTRVAMEIPCRPADGRPIPG